MVEVYLNVTVENIYFSDHNAVRIAIHNIMLIFKLIRKIC